MEIKNIVLPTQTKEKETREIKRKKEEKQPKKRVVTETSAWTKHIVNDNMVQEEELEWLSHILLDEDEHNFDSKKKHFLRELIHQKINGYKYQDEKKLLYSPTEFVSLDYVIELLQTCELKCFYCKGLVKLWYEISREPTQWTLERIDNKYGHNKGNVEVACLSCNLKRRTMYHERFVFTKQMKLEKMN